jgi:hypothetical protein
MMSFGFATLFVIVIVVVLTAPAGVVAGLVGLGPDDADDVELGLELELPHPVTHRVAAAQAAARNALVFMTSLDPNSLQPLHHL